METNWCGDGWDGTECLLEWVPPTPADILFHPVHPESGWGMGMDTNCCGDGQDGIECLGSWWDGFQVCGDGWEWDRTKILSRAQL